VKAVQFRVDAAADALLLTGVEPTVTKVRAQMGGGSPNAVTPALAYWRVRLKARLDARSRGDELPSTLIDAARAFYAHALQVAAEKKPATARDDREQLKVELDRTKSQLRHAERELEEQREQRALLFEAAGRTHGSLVEAQVLAQHCAAQARELQAKLDAAKQELGAARSRITVLEAKLALAATKKPRPGPRQSPSTRPGTAASRPTAKRKRPRRR
jgi:hypothetical protein